ncbi:glycoside hydrolase family 43 protein [Zasmidium cellare ATCC 36951]|uniref:Endo-1,5-alpha-L-arabinanase A n=1 Tax=Zasmidium cellare ATCC 36951 TaxID=1080233 RepID=A0A6A6BYK0_ZASCE|nr:glycoside hydrolase family 43 protein [Zasmidium cellare ATCC 36951]KAF2158486.1 glycoside hydrolase family 43 protein [Zasmidium cellare ATCC 36951]
MGSMNSDIGVATSTAMEPGSWTGHGSIGLPKDSRYNKIDANLYFPSGASTPSLNFGSFWQNIFQAPMSNPPLTVPFATITHLAQNTTVRPTGLVTGSMEGAYQFSWEGYTYLSLSSGNCCSEPANDTNPYQSLAPPGEEYHIMVCRSAQASGGIVDQQG